MDIPSPYPACGGQKMSWIEPNFRLPDGASTAQPDAELARASANMEAGPELRFGPYRLILRERRLERDGVLVPLGGRAMDILSALVGRAGEVITKRELAEAAWPGMVVEEGSLRFHIASLRKALCESAQTVGYITTVAGRGYCFTGQITWTDSSGGAWGGWVIDGPKLPQSLRRTIGNEKALAEAATGLVAHHFLTLVGPPGIGKTTLAIQLGREVGSMFPDGVAFVDLAAISVPSLVPNAVAAATGRLLPPEHTFENLVDVLHGRRMLLIVDGCEHLVDAVAELAERLFRHLPMLAILATSRESLRADGEHVYRLFPLACPPEREGLMAAEALAYAAVQLFVDRVQANQLGYVFSDEDAPLVSEICRKLDGIPLALELAASRVPSYGIKQTASLLDGHFRLLWQGRRTAPPRHQTLSAALDWSYDLLSVPERQLLRRVSVFVGSFMIAAAEAVATCEGTTSHDVVQLLADLVSKSLLVLDEDEEGVHYRLLDTTRVYALSKLLATEEAPTIVRRHALFIRDKLEEDAALDAFFSRPGINPYNGQIGDVRAALQWSFSAGEEDGLAASLAAASAPLFLELSLADESREWAERGLTALTSADRGGLLEARLQAALGIALLTISGDREGAERAFRRGLAIAQDMGDSYNELRFLGGLHVTLIRFGDFKGALAVAEQARAAAEALDDASAISMTEAMLTVAHHFAGNHIESRGHHAAAIAQPSASARTTNMQFGIDHRSRMKAALARDLWIRGNPLAAHEAAWQAVDETARLANPHAHATSLVFSAAVFFWQGDLLAAQDMVSRLVEHADRHVLLSYIAIGSGLEGILELRRGHAEAGAWQIADALARLKRMRFEAVTPWFEGALAECEACMGLKAEALARIDSALGLVIRNGDRFNMPDLLRVKGDILASEPADFDAAARCLEEAMAWARAQSAYAWELRAAVSYARIRFEQGRASEAAPRLEAAIGLFDPEMAGGEYRTAAELLAQIKSEPRSPTR